MAKFCVRKGNNIVEYILTFLLVGFVLGYAIWSINPDVFRKYFRTTFNNSSNVQDYTITVGPISE